MIPIQRNALGRMRWAATLALALVFCGMIGFRIIEPWHPAFGYLRAFCEAATVGALADWFAVVALFRHPMGIPIPHTAILPNNKMRVAESLADFIDSNFLNEKEITDRVRSLDFAKIAASTISANRTAMIALAMASAGRWLASEQAATVPASISAQCQTAWSKIDFPALAGNALESLFSGSMAETIHRTVLQSMAGLITENRLVIQEQILGELPLSGELVRGFPGGQHFGPAIDQLRNQIAASLTEKTVENVRGLLADAVDCENHPIRKCLQTKVSDWIAETQSSPALQGRINAFKSEHFSGTEIDVVAGQIWSGIRAALLRDIDAPEDSEIRTAIARGIDAISQALAESESLRSSVNGLIANQIADHIPTLRLKTREHIHSTILKWDPADIATKLETTVGRDLQFIRLNGTIIGGLIGVVIHAGFKLAGI